MFSKHRSPHLLLITFHSFLFTSFFFLLSCSSTPQPQQPTQTSLFIYRFEPPALIEFSEDLQPVREIPFSIPPSCGLFDIFSAPIGQHLSIELNCPNGQTVLFLDTETGSATQPITDSDAHFLAWTPDGTAAYIKVDALGNARVLLADVDGTQKEVEITGWTYDLAARPSSGDLLFSFSRGLGSGSELNFTTNNGRTTKTLYSDSLHYVAFARYSPDGKQVAFIKIPDSSTPFTVGELWLMDADGSQARKLADVDAGHGYAANWSPDGTQIAFVNRENPQDANADRSTESLISNIYTIDVQNGTLSQVTHLEDGRAETPHWSPDGNTLAFHQVIDGRMNAFTVDILTGKPHPLITESSCCPAWMRK